MKILICAGHTLEGKGTGAVGYLNESQENRGRSKIIVKYLSQAGHNVDYYEINKSDNYLSDQVTTANSKKYDLVVQVHFNAYKNTNDEMGTETLYISDKGKVYSEKINAKLSTIFKSRGAKRNQQLYWLRNTNPVSVLIETCFIDSKSDIEKYKANKDKVGKLIAEAIHGKSIEEEKIFYRVVAGSYTNKNLAEAQAKLLEDKGIKGVFLDIYKK